MYLALFSGGADSTAMLKWLLEDTIEEIHAHHVIIKYNTPRPPEPSKISAAWDRWEPELEAARAIAKYLANSCRLFKYTEAERGGPQASVMRSADPYTVSVEALEIIKAASRGRYTRVCRGTMAEDLKRKLPAPDINIHFRAIRELHEVDPDVLYYYPIHTWMKKEVLEYLEPELRRLTLSCRYPVNHGGEWVTCGYCIACTEIGEN